MPTGVPLTPAERALRDLETGINKLLKLAVRETAMNRKLKDQLAALRRDLR